MTDETDSPDQQTDAEYYRNKQEAAPYAARALFIRRPDGVWVPVLGCLNDIEKDIVVIAVANESGTFDTLVDFGYSNGIDLIFDEETARDIELPLAADAVERADDIVSNLEHPTWEPPRSV